MPVLSGKEAIRIIKQNHSKINIIILSSHYRKSVIVDFIKLGASAFLSKHCDKSKLIEAINTVYSDGSYFDKEVSIIMAKELSKTSANKNNDDETLKFSDIELNIIKMICQNKTSKEIADALNLSPRTVEWHRMNIMTKIKSNKVADLLVYAIKNNLVTVL
jgi:DNA-binding NarL/FixJ family response regulator